jgi:hypothetical protein
VDVYLGEFASVSALASAVSGRRGIEDFGNTPLWWRIGSRAAAATTR